MCENKPKPSAVTIDEARELIVIDNDICPLEIEIKTCRNSKDILDWAEYLRETAWADVDILVDFLQVAFSLIRP